MRDGVWFVQLASATDPEQVIDLTAHELDLDDRGAESLTKMLHRRLASAELLLVLDNCEHLVDAVAALVEGVLTHCPHVRILATSRELLGVRGERATTVAPLGVGDPSHPGDAVSLFIERAQAATALDAIADYELIADVCRRLDGLPLAIELAAARLRSMSLTQVASKLDDRFTLLTGGFRTDTGRQRTLEAVVAWSYDLLDDTEQATFRRLSIFAGSFSLDAAEAVAGWAVVNAADVLDLVGRLVDKSLVATVQVHGEYRYQLLETLRQYGRQQLAATREWDESTSRLFDWARARMEQLRVDLRTALQDKTLAAALPDRENFRAVYMAARDTNDLDLALRIATFAQVMLVRERRAAIRELLTVIVDVDPVLHGHALTSCAQFSFNMGLFAEGAEAAKKSAVLFEDLGDRQHAAWARYFEMFNAWGFSSDEVVRDLSNSLLEEFRVLDSPLGLAYALWVSSQLEPDVTRAEALATESEELFRTIESPFGLGHELEGRALIALRGGDPTRAAGYLREALHLLSDGTDQGCTAHVIEAVASLVSSLGHGRDAALLLGAAEELRRTSGQAHRPWELRSRELAEQALAVGDFDDARSEGRQLDFQKAVGVANALLNRPDSESPPRPLTQRSHA
jgi:non-specific serine/threonine protein kinase